MKQPKKVVPMHKEMAMGKGCCVPTKKACGGAVEKKACGGKVKGKK